MTGRRALGVLLAGALAGGLLGGCSSVDEELSAMGGLSDLSGLYPAPAPTLEPALRLDGAPATTSVGAGYAPAPSGATVDDGTVVVATDSGATAYDADTHDELWSRDLAKVGGCGVSEVVDGRVAVLTGRRSYGECLAVAMLDVGTGDELWRRDVGGDQPLIRDGAVALGPGSVYAGGSCGSVLRFDPATGAPQPPLLADDRVCGHGNGMRGNVIALWEDPETAETPDDLGTGWIPPYDGAGRLRVVDASTGEEVWSRTLDRDGTDVQAVVSTDPLVLDVTEKGHRTLQRYDEDGELVGHLGAQLGDLDFLVSAQTDGVLVGTYEGVAGYFAYDLETGEELWRVTDDLRWLAGADDRGLIWTQTDLVADGGEVDTESQVVRTSLDDPTTGELLGALPGPGAGSGVVGDDLLVPGIRRTTVYPLGEGIGPAPAAYDAYASLYPWRADDVRPEETIDFCDAVNPSDVAAVGIDTALPTPVDCRWREWDDPSYLEKDLEVDVAASSPGTTADGEKATAAAVAAESYAETHGGWAPLGGLGDEARSSRRQSADGRTAAAAVEVLAGNVRLTVEASVSARVPRTTRGAVPAARLEQVVLDIAADVLGALELPVDPDALPDPGEAGPVEEAPDVCRAVGGLGAEVAGPLARRTDSSPEQPSLSSCGWSLDTDEVGTNLDVVAFAVPPGLLPDGEGEVPSALEVADGLRLSGRPYPAAGPEARLSGSGEPGEYVSRTLWVRRGNLVVMVDGTAYEEPLPTGADLEADLVRVADRVLDATRR